jgi:hypothetical protein
MPKYRYFQETGGEEAWKPCPVSFQDQLVAEKHPAFFTVLAVSQLADELASEDRNKLKYAGPLYFDWDGEDMVAVSEEVHKLCLILESKGLDMACAQLYATGGRGFHLEVPMACFMAKVPKEGVQYLPIVYKQLAFDVAVEHLDFRVYSGGRGRMWRTCGVKRENGHYKVPITYEELQNITTESYAALTSSPRLLPTAPEPKLCMELMVMFDRAQQVVADRLSKRKKKNTDPSVLRKQSLPSLDALLQGRGVRDDAGFHQIALQLAIVAEAIGWSETELADKAEGLCAAHSSDSGRYNTPEKRRSELIRMHRYIDGNPCYEFSIGGVKSLLNHDAPDLDGIPVSREDVEDSIKKAAEAPAADGAAEEILDEYADVASGVSLTKFGLYANTDEGKKRISAISMERVHTLRSAQTGQVACYEADILVNGKFQGRQTLELDVFGGLQAFNKFAGRYSHALQGSDQHVRGMMMRVAEKAKKEGKELYVVNREGLDIINIVNHEDPEMREPFMVWADNKGVVLEPRIAAKGYEFSFQGYPDPRGAFRTDISEAPKLVEWIEEPGNKETMRGMLQNFLTCQQPNFVAKLVGWYTAAFYRMLFHKVYNKFPILHVNGAAGAGKTEMNKTMLSLFFYQQEGKTLTPGSTLFALQQHLSGSASVPLIIDEYKPHEMPVEMHGKLKLMFRDGYNCRDVTRGGGNRENDDYRSLYTTQLSAPMVVIAEAAEEEAAVMERVVLCTMVRPPASVAMKWSTRFHIAERNKRCLSILGQYIASGIVLDYGFDHLAKEFDALLGEAQAKYMLSEKDLVSGLSQQEIQAKQGAKERTVFNYTVVKFGLQKFRTLIADIFETEFDEIFDELEASVYERMADLLPSTQAEWIKVLNKVATMSVTVDASSPMAVRHRQEYAFLTFRGKSALELSARAVYHRYRAYCRSTSERPLFPGDHAFLHGLKDCPALMQHGAGEQLSIPGGSFIFDLDELSRMGVEPFKA